MMSWIKTIIEIRKQQLFDAVKYIALSDTSLRQAWSDSGGYTLEEGDEELNRIVIDEEEWTYQIETANKLINKYLRENI